MNYKAKDYWDKFGAQRFTKADLWAAFGNRSFPGFPSPEWLDEIGIGRVSWIEQSPGPRGGEGWKLTDKCVNAIQAQEARAKLLTNKLQALLAAVRPKVGECRCVGDRLEWSFRPPVELPGRHPNGRRRYGDRFELKWPVSSSATAIQKQLDAAADHIAKLAMVEREKRLAAIAKLDALISASDTARNNDG